MNFKFYTLFFIGLFLTCLLHTSFAQIPQDGLVGYYMLDGNAVDSSGLDNHGTIIDQVNPTPNRFGEIDKACSFDGGYIDAGNPMAFQITDSITIAAWIRLDQMDSWCGIVSKWDGTGYFLGINPTDNILRWNLGSSGSVNGNSISFGDWVHVAAAYDGDKIELYENGVLVSSLFHNTPIVNTPINLIIGKQSDSQNNKFLGAIDDVLIYNRGLSDMEIESIYNAVVSSTQNIYSYDSVLVSPNPANNTIKITNKNEEKIKSYTLYSASGTEIMANTFQEELDIRNQPSGIYYLILNFEYGSVTKKVVKF